MPQVVCEVRIRREAVHWDGVQLNVGHEWIEFVGWDGRTTFSAGFWPTGPFLLHTRVRCGAQTTWEGPPLQLSERWTYIGFALVSTAARTARTRIATIFNNVWPEISDSMK